MTNFTVQVEAAKLLRAMKVAGQVVERRNTIPILGNVLFDARDGGVTITATDMDVQFVQRIEADVDEPLRLTIQTEKLMQIVSALDAGAFLKFAADVDHRVVIASGRSRWKVPTLPADDFPGLPQVGDLSEITLASSLLASLLNRAMPFVGGGVVKTYFNGPFWHEDDGRLCIAASDGNAFLQIVAGDVKWPDGGEEAILAPKACKIVAQMCEDTSEARFAWGDGRFRLQIGEAVLIAKSIEGNFPDYRRFIPARSDSPMIGDPSQMSGAISRLKVAADQKTNAVNIDIEGEVASFAMLSKTSNTQAREEVPVEVGAQQPTAFNQVYLKAMLDAVGGDSIEIHQSGPSQPARFERVVNNGVVGMIGAMAR